ncbi:MAG: S8 family serine peptidase [Kangiellaceae bacterium]|nr:S8 family serine peptidase [Kangiellaceae bacterium]
MKKIHKNFAPWAISTFLTIFSISIDAKPPVHNSEIAKYEKGYLLHQQTYIVQLKPPSLVNYSGGLEKLEATNLKSNYRINQFSGLTKLNTKSNASIAYKSFLKQHHQDTLTSISTILNKEIKTQFEYTIAINGYAVILTPEEASTVAQLDFVKSIQVASQHKAQTDRGPLLINAPAAWNGTATGVSAKGEGVLVGVIDTGVRSNHQSFAEISPDDGYNHINPLGNGIFLGYCASNIGFCNNKLIGAYNYAEDETDPEDETGHGTHVASTAVGNTLTFDLGTGNGFELTGVAPRANLIVYRIASEDSATRGATLMAIDQAIDNGVDVINYSFGGSAFNPWNSSDNIGFRNARAAGIIVVTSAGNEGPNPETVGSPAIAPWITSVAASTHDRGAYPTKTLSNMSGGSSSAPSTITGRSLTGAITDSIVYAANFSNGDTNPEQCLNPFPANTFNGQIVVCDRGDIARVQKAKNVAAGGAGGYVLANVQGGSTFLADDIYVIPGIQIVAADGDNLKSWLAGGSGHTGTINGTNGTVGVNPQAADIVASFSSRGANAIIPNIIKPSVSAPGVSILAAGIGEVDYTFLQGTSMASPHVAGAAVLIRQLKPNWSAGQIHSALVSTAVTNLRKEDSVTTADAFDIGGGRIDISTALNAGLLMDETNGNFIAADPASGGNPKNLNLPSMADLSCSVSCSWSRTVSAAVTGSWNVSFISDLGLNLSVNPSSFTLNAGQFQQLTITASITGVDGNLLFGQLVLSPDDANVSTAHFPIAIRVNNSTLPNNVTISSQRDAGQHRLSGITSVTSASLSGTGYLVESIPLAKSLPVDSDNSSAFDDLADEVSVELINVTAGSQLVFATTTNSTATDLDLFVGFDSNGDGQAQEFELLKSSTSPNAEEEVLINKPQAGTYWVLVQNFSGAETGDDSYTFATGVVGPTPSGDISISVPSSSDGATPFNVDINFDNITANKYYGVVALGSGGTNNNLGSSTFNINRLADDVSLTSSATSVAVDQSTNITISIQPNSNQTRNYTTSLSIPTGLTVNVADLSNGASFANNTVSWEPNVNGGTTQISFDVTVDSTVAGQTVNLSLLHNVDTPNAKQQTATTSFSVSGSSSGGGGSGGSGGNSSSGNSGGGSMHWLLLVILFMSIGIRQNQKLRY